MCRRIRGHGRVARGDVICSMGLGCLVEGGGVRCRGLLGGGGLPFLDIFRLYRFYCDGGVLAKIIAFYVFGMFRH